MKFLAKMFVAFVPCLYFVAEVQVIASVGLDKKLYTFDSGSRRHSFCIPYEAPFSSLAYRDDGLILAAGTSNGQVVFYDVRGKPEPLTVLRAFGNSEVNLLPSILRDMKMSGSVFACLLFFICLCATAY